MKTIPGEWSFTRWTTVDQLEALEVRHPLFQARLFLQGAHLTHYAPNGEGNWLWLSDTARYRTGHAIRGGIPVCWPWFGTPSRNPPEVREHILSEYAHGFARTAVWELEDVQETAKDVEVSLSLDTGSDFTGDWQGQARALITFRFSADALQIALTTTNLVRTPLALSQALHTYLPTTDIGRTTIHGFDQTSYVDTLQDWQHAQQLGPIHFAGETDRIYAEPAANLISVETPVGSYQLLGNGSQSTVVWNPGPDKAARLSDFPDEAWQSMLCVETANALEDFRVLNSGQSHTLGVMIQRKEGAKENP